MGPLCFAFLPQKELATYEVLDHLAGDPWIGWDLWYGFSFERAMRMEKMTLGYT